MARAPIENHPVVVFWMKVMQASVIYDSMRRYHNRILHRARHRNWRAKRELFKMSGFGLDASGRVATDPLVWEKHLKDNPDAKNLKGKLCPCYYDLAITSGTATKDRTITRNDFMQMNGDEINHPVGVSLGDEDEVEEAHPINSSMPKEAAQWGDPRAKRKRGKSMDDAVIALGHIAQFLEKIAIVFEKQATQSHVDVQAILNKL